MKRTLLILLIVLAPIVVAAVECHQEVPRRFFEVEPGRLYRGGFPSGDHVRKLHNDRHVQTVISLTSDEDKPRDKDLERAIRELRMHHYRFPMNGDGTGELAVLDHAADALANADEGPIFFHCAAGKQRTSATLGAYWIKHRGKTIDQALQDLVRDYDLDMDGDDKDLTEHLRKYARFIGDRSRQARTGGATGSAGTD